MINYIRAEGLKCKRTFITKLMFLAPLVVFILPGTFSPRYMVLDAYNWWQVLILPGYISLLCILLNQYEEKKKHYMGVFCLPVQLKNVWISKILILLIYLFISLSIHLFLVLAGKYLIFYLLQKPEYVQNYSNFRLCAGSLMLFLTTAWEIPLCLFMAKKFGFLATLLWNVVFGQVINFYFVLKSVWWISPYSWNMRLMAPIIGVLPNGLPAGEGNPLLDSHVIPVGISLSLLLCVFFIYITAIWFSKQEVTL